MRAAIVCLALLLISCSPASSSNAQGNSDLKFTPERQRQYAQVEDENAPTVAGLKARGLEQAGWDAEMFACGTSCDGIFAYAIFMGRKPQYQVIDKGGRKIRVRVKQAEYLFTCPNPLRPQKQDDWTCSKFAGVKGPH